MCIEVPIWYDLNLKDSLYPYNISWGQPYVKINVTNVLNTQKLLKLMIGYMFSETSTKN